MELLPWIEDSQSSQFRHQSRKTQNGDDGDDGGEEEEYDEFVDHALENEVYCGFYVDLVAQVMINTR